MTEKSLYERLSGYDAIAAFANDLLQRLQADDQNWDDFGPIVEMMALLEKSNS